MDHTKEYWNHQHIRQNFSSESPEFPSLSYSIPAASYTRDYVSDISGNLIEEMYDIYGRIVSNFGCTNYVELVLILTRENSLSYPTNFAEAVNLCLSLINVTSYFQKQPPEVFHKK